MKTYIGEKSISVTLGLLTVRRSIGSNGRMWNQAELFLGQDDGTIIRRPEDGKLRYFVQTWAKGKPQLEELKDESTIMDARAEFAGSTAGSLWAQLELQASKNAPKFCENAQANTGEKTAGALEKEQPKKTAKAEL